MESSVKDLEVLIRSRVPIIRLETTDERRALEVFKRLAIRIGHPVMRWSVTTGLQRIDLDLEPQPHAREPAQVLGQIKATSNAGIYLLLDFHPYLEDPYNVRMLKEIALDYPTLHHTVVLVSHDLVEFMQRLVLMREPRFELDEALFRHGYPLFTFRISGRIHARFPE